MIAIRWTARRAVAAAFYGAFLATAIALPAQAPPASPATPEAFANRFMATLTAGDFAANAALMHPVALASVRRIVLTVTARDSSAPALKQFAGVTSRHAIEQMSDVKLYEQFVSNMLGAQQGVLAALKSATIAVVGHVDEAPDLTHVIYRITMKLGEIQVTKLDVLTLRKDGAAWRAMLTGDAENFIAAMSQQDD